MDLFEDNLPIIFEEGKAEIFYYSDFFSKKEALKLFQEINTQVDWKRETIVMFGKELPIPRDTAWFGDRSYTYSGIKNEPSSFTPLLLKIKQAIENKTNETFNSLLINRYKSGDDKVDWHSDDEPELSKESSIASLTLGEPRDFLMRQKGRSGDNKKILLQDGSLLLMKPPTQEFWEHSIPKRSGITETRINLTFRNVLGG